MSATPPTLQDLRAEAERLGLGEILERIEAELKRRKAPCDGQRITKDGIEYELRAVAK